MPSGYISDRALTGNSAAYSIHYPPGTSDTIAVDVATGAISTKGPLDYETRKTYALLAMPLAGGDATRVRIDVLDENDNAPTFPPPARVTLALSEVAIEGTHAFGREEKSVSFQVLNSHCRLQRMRTQRRILCRTIASSQGMLTMPSDWQREDRQRDFMLVSS